MAVKITGPGAGSLRFPDTTNKKPALSNGQGWWCARWLRAPGAYGSSATYASGYDSNSDGDFTDASEAGFGVGVSSTKKLRFFYRPSSTTDCWTAGGLAGGAANDSAMDALTPGGDYLIIWGFRDHSGSGDWRMFRTCLAKNASMGAGNWEFSAAHASITTAAGAAHRIIDRIFQDSGSQTGKSPTAGNTMGMEGVIAVSGVFPWDVGGLHPDFTVIEGLANGTYKYSDAAVLNGGTILDWRKLVDSTDLGNYGSDGSGALTMNGTVTDETPIAPVTNPLLSEPATGFVWAGRSAGTLSYTGTYLGTAPGAIKARIRSAGVAVASFDWQQVVASPSGNAFSFSFANVPEGGPYRIDVRWGDDTATQQLGSNDFYCGTVIVLWGQSQCVHLNGNGSGVVTPTAGHKCSVMTCSDRSTLATINTVVPAAAADCGAGMASLINAWHAETSGKPMMIVEVNYSGTAIRNWVANSVPGDGSTILLFGDGSVSTSGLATYMMKAARGQADKVVYFQGTSDVNEEQASGPYYAADMEILRAGNGTIVGFAGLIVTPFKVAVLPHPRSNDDGTNPGNKTWKLREVQYQQTVSDPTNYDLLGWLNDWMMDSNGSPHQSDSATTGNQRGGTRIGTLLGRLCVTGTDRLGPQATSAQFTSAGKTAFTVTFDRDVEVADGVDSGLKGWLVSTNSWVTTVNYQSTYEAGFTVARTGARTVTVTKSAGSWSGNPKVGYQRGVPYDTTTALALNGNESAFPATFADKFLYDTTSLEGGRGMPAAPTVTDGLTISDYVAPAASSTVQGGMSLSLSMGL
jgi:hypothetical protein